MGHLFSKKESNNEAVIKDRLQPILQHRRSKRAIARVVVDVIRANSINMALVGLVTAVAAIFIIAVSQEYIGNFTINLNRLDMYKRGLQLSETADFKKPQSRLRSDPIDRVTNISINDLPRNIELIDGKHNGKNYIAYTFYVKNAGLEDLDYKYAITVDSKSKNVDSAIRVGFYYNSGERILFAKANKNGLPEEGCVPFSGDDVVQATTVSDFNMGQIDRYTVVIWLEGDDPDCTDELLGGMVKLSMKVEALEKQQEDKKAV